MGKRVARRPGVVMNIRNVDPAVRRRMREIKARYDLPLGTVLGVLVRCFDRMEAEASRSTTSGSIGVKGALREAGLPDLA